MKPVEILGYVNCVNRPSVRMRHPTKGEYVEVISDGAFKYALMFVGDLPILVNHQGKRKIASLNNGVNYLYEDNIGLRISIDTTDLLVIKAAKSRKIKGWSFSFEPVEEVWSIGKDGVQVRTIRKMKLKEISIVIGKNPAYPHTLWEIKGQPFTPSVERQIELDLSNKELELLKLRGRFIT